MSDKILHIVCSAALVFAFAFVFTPIQSVILALIVGFFKEIYDWFSGKGTPDGKDLIADFIGAICMYLLI